MTGFSVSSSGIIVSISNVSSPSFDIAVDTTSSLLSLLELAIPASIFLYSSISLIFLDRI